MIGSILAAIGASIGGHVVTYIRDNQEANQFDRMQAEILEGWLYKLEVAIREEHRKNGVSEKIHKKVIQRCHKIVMKEFDARKL